MRDSSFIDGKCVSIAPKPTEHREGQAVGHGFLDKRIGGSSDLSCGGEEHVTHSLGKLLSCFSQPVSIALASTPHLLSRRFGCGRFISRVRSRPFGGTRAVPHRISRKGCRLMRRWVGHVRCCGVPHKGFPEPDRLTPATYSELHARARQRSASSCSTRIPKLGAASSRPPQPRTFLCHFCRLKLA